MKKELPPDDPTGTDPPSASEPLDLPSGPGRCPRCRDRVQPTSDRWVLCRACLARHHERCWLGACGACGAAVALPGDSTAPRRPWARAALVVAAALVAGIAWAASMRAGRSGVDGAASVPSAIEMLDLDAAVDRLVRAADDAERRRAAEVVHGFGPRALAALLDACEDPGRQGGALLGLAALAPWATELATGAEPGRNKDERRLGLRVVARLSRDALPALTSLLQHGDWSVRLSAVQLIEKLGPSAAPAAPDLVRTLEGDPHGYVREWALKAIGAIGPDAIRAARPQVVAALAGPNVGLADEASRHVPALGPSVASEAIPPLLEHVRARRGSEPVLRALAFLVPHAPEVALPGLIASLEQDRLPVFALVRRLGASRRHAAPALASALLVPDLHDGAKALLVELGPEAEDAVPRLTEALQVSPRSGSGVRLAVVEVLARVGGPGAIEALELATRDADRTVQIMAREALARLRPVSQRATGPARWPTIPAVEPYADVDPPSLLPAGLRPTGGGEYLLERDGSVLVWVPSGAFTMGRPGVDDEGPPHQVRVSGFFMGKHEVTWAQYRRFCAERGREGPRAELDGHQLGDDAPVFDVSWFDAVEYCAWAGACLPTEAQWEYAARGGDGRLYPWGSDSPAGSTGRVANLADATWLAGQSARKRTGAIQGYDDGARFPAPVGSFPAGASPSGCHDLSGNVWEWVQDWFGDYAEGATADPVGPSDARARRNGRVVRGGCWYSDEREATATAREAMDAADTDPGVGFRLCVPARGVPARHAVRLVAESLLGDRDLLVAAQALARFGPEAADAIPTVVSALEPYPGAHLPMCEAVARLGPAGEACLVELALGRDDALHCAAAAVLATRSADQALLAFDSAIDGDVLARRRRAPRALGTSSVLASRRLPTLVSLLSDPDAQVRVHAAGAIAAVGTGAVGATEALVRALRDSEPAVVLQATWTLSRVARSALAVEALAPALVSPDAGLATQTEEALVTIGRLEPVSCGPTLSSTLEDPSPDHRLVALRILARIGPAAASIGAVDGLATSDASPVVRAAALEALAALRGGAAVPSCLRALSPEEAVVVRLSALQALGRLGHAARAAEQPLTGLSADADPVVRAEAERALARIRSRSAERALLGVECWSDVGPLGMGLDGGAIVRTTTPGTPATSIGLQLGDIIVAVDGQPVTDRAALTRAIALRRPGDRVSITIVRGGGVRCAIVELGSR